MRDLVVQNLIFVVYVLNFFYAYFKVRIEDDFFKLPLSLLFLFLFLLSITIILFSRWMLSAIVYIKYGYYFEVTSLDLLCLESNLLIWCIIKVNVLLRSSLQVLVPWSENSYASLCFSICESIAHTCFKLRIK